MDLPNAVENTPEPEPFGTLRGGMTDTMEGPMWVQSFEWWVRLVKALDLPITVPPAESRADYADFVILMKGISAWIDRQKTSRNQEPSIPS